MRFLFTMVFTWLNFAMISGGFAAGFAGNLNLLYGSLALGIPKKPKLGFNLCEAVRQLPNLAR
jgi:hypothetical protein